MGRSSFTTPLFTRLWIFFAHVVNIWVARMSESDCTDWLPVTLDRHHKVMGLSSVVDKVFQVNALLLKLIEKSLLDRTITRFERIHIMDAVFSEGMDLVVDGEEPKFGQLGLFTSLGVDKVSGDANGVTSFEGFLFKAKIFREARVET